jgi:hypothetical protein
MSMSKCLINRFLFLTVVVAGGILRAGSPAFAAEKLVGLQSAPRALKVSAQQLIDRRFLEEVEKDGTFDRLGMK